MKCILRGYGIRMTTEERAVARSQAKDMTIARGTARVPTPPRDVFLQSGPRGILVNWRAPEGLASDISGWRVYKDNEGSLFADLRDPTTTQHYIESTSGATPPITNIFVSSINKLGKESPLIPAQGVSLAEAGAPIFPPTPPTFNKPSGGGNQKGNTF